MTIERNVGCAGIVRRRLDLADSAPFRHIFRRDLGPSLAFVASDLDEAVVGADPKQTFFNGRLGDGEDGVVELGAGVVERDVAAGGLLLALVVAREVGTDYLPVHTTVSGFEQP